MDNGSGTQLQADDPSVLAASERSPGGGQTGTRRVLRALVIGPVLKEQLAGGQTKTIPQEDFLENLSAEGRIIQPPFDKLVLAMLPENSTELYQVIDAMQSNIEGFGFRLECRVRLDDPDCPPEVRKEALAEKTRLLNFFSNCNVDDSFTSMNKKKRWDIETTGEGFWEIIRSTSGQIVGLNHVPSYQVRLGTVDDKFTRFARTVPMLQPDGSITLEKMITQKRFRRFLQARIGLISRAFAESKGYDVRWFKEFGDPRPIHIDTGEVIQPDQLDRVSEEKRAGEMAHFKLYSPRTPYGLPRYVGNIITVFGDRAADEVNFVTLKNNNVPSMLLLVSNGQLTEASIKRIQEFTESQIAGSDNYSRFLLVEAEGQFEGQEQGISKIDVKPLTSEQMRDQLFQEYSKNNREKIRECFRLPPIFVGRSDDYTRATAEASRRLADEQVFRPERDEFDNWMNKHLLPEMGVRYHRFVSNGPNITDDEDLIRVLMAAEKTGGLTPRLSREIMSDILGRELPPILPDTVPPDVPFSLTLAETVKNQAGMEVGQQVTAVKTLVKRLQASPTGSAVQDLLAIREALETELARRLG